MIEETCELLCLDAAKAESLRRGLPGGEQHLGLALALRDGGELCVCDLAFVSGRQDKLVSHHLRQLRAGGLARSRKDGRMVLYSLTEDGTALLAAVMHGSPAGVAA